MLAKVGVIANYTALEAVRNRLFRVIFIIVIASIGLVELVSQFAITESQQIQSAVLGSVLRITSVLFLSLFVITSMFREFSDKGFELVLSLPIPRAGYYFGKLFGFFLIAFIVACLVCIPLFLYVPPGQVLVWSLSLCLELLIITALSLLCVFTFRNVAVAFMSVLAFYFLSRSIGDIQLIGHGSLAGSDKLSQQLINFIVDAISYVLPGLDRFTSSEWLVYHTASLNDFVVVLGQSVIYLLVLSAVALFDLYRKNL